MTRESGQIEGPSNNLAAAALTCSFMDLMTQASLGTDIEAPARMPPTNDHSETSCSCLSSAEVSYELGRREKIFELGIRTLGAPDT